MANLYNGASTNRQLCTDEMVTIASAKQIRRKQES